MVLKKQDTDETSLSITTETSPLLIEEEEQNEEQIKRKYSLKHILPALWLGTFLAAMDGTIVANIMSPIAASFEQEDLKQWIVTSYLLTNAGFQPLYGKVSDIVGRKYALLFAQFFFGFGCLLSGFANSVPQLALTRAISGIGGGGVLSLGSIITSDIVSIEERGLFQGYSNVCFAAAQMIGGPLGGWALNTIGWRWAFAIQAPLVAICMLLTSRNVNIKPREEFSMKNFKRIDFAGSGCLLFLISSFLLLLGSDLNKLVLFGVMGVSISAFLYIEKYVAEEQIIPANLFKGTLGVLVVISFTIVFTSSSLLFGIPVFLQVIQGQSLAASGRYLVTIVVPGAGGSLFAGYLIRRLKVDIKKSSVWITFVSIVILLAMSLLLLGVMKYPPPYDPRPAWKIALVLALGIFGFAYGQVLVSTLILIVGIVGSEGQAAATSLNYLFRSVSQVLGAGISLSFYEIILSKNLSILLEDVPNGEIILKNLLRNASYIKTGELIDDTLRVKILEVYQHAMSGSFIPTVAILVLAVLISGILAFKKGF